MLVVPFNSLFFPKYVKYFGKNNVKKTISGTLIKYNIGCNAIVSKNIFLNIK